MITPTPAHLSYLGTLQLPPRGPLGDVQLGSGLAARPDGTLFFGVAPSTVLAGQMPPGLSGPVALHKVGVLPCEWQYPNGLGWDESDQALYMSCHSAYDGDVATSPTLSRGRFDAAGTLVPDGRWAFTGRTDKQTDGGICVLPPWLGTLGVGFGMYRSMVSIGAASMGLALASFLRPATSGVPIGCKPLLGYPYRAGGTAPRMRRSSDYINEFHDGYPIYPGVGAGVTTWADYGYQCATWIETQALSGFVGIVMRGTGRCFYTNTINAEGWRYDWVAYAGDDFRTGAPQDALQPQVDVPFDFPGRKANGPHADAPPYPVKGVCYEPANRWLLVRIQGLFGAGSTLADGVLVYKVIDPLRAFTGTRIQAQSVQAIDETDALSKLQEGAWQTTALSIK